jgi:hypothetical protein
MGRGGRRRPDAGERRAVPEDQPMLYRLLVVAASFFVCPAWAQEELKRKKEPIPIVWAREETKSYAIEYEKGIAAHVLKRVTGEIDDILEQYVRVFREKPKEKLKVKFLENPRTFEQEGGDPSHPGHYNPSTKYLVIQNLPFERLIPIVYHEAFHQYLAMYVGDHVAIPTWFNEGMASYFEEMQREKGTKKLSPKLIDKRKLRMIKDAIFTRTTIALETLVDASHEEFHDKDREQLFYTQSFSVIYFLMQANPRAVIGYMQELRDKKDVEAANAKIFGPQRKNLKRIEKTWKEYTARLDLEVASGR